MNMKKVSTYLWFTEASITNIFLAIVSKYGQYLACSIIKLIQNVQ